MASPFGGESPAGPFLLGLTPVGSAAAVRAADGPTRLIPSRPKGMWLY